MRIGIYQDLRDPPRWRRGWGVNAGAALERAEEAEKLGFEAAWCTEHHFFADGYLPQPLTWCTAVAARTDHLALGTAVIIAPLHSPIDLAEQAAIVDQLCGGRFQLGLGAGYVPREFEAFGTDRQQRFDRTESCLNEIRRLYEEGIVTPGPVQRDLPMWFGGFGPRGARLAGRNRAGLLFISADLLDPYLQGLAEGGHSPEMAAMGGVANMIVSNDPERAWSMVAPHAGYARRANEYAAHAKSVTDRMAPQEETVSVERTTDLSSVTQRRSFDAVTPEQAVRKIETWIEDLPVSDIFFFDSLAAMPDELVQEHMTLVGTEVAPRVRGLGRAPRETQIQ